MSKFKNKSSIRGLVITLKEGSIVLANHGELKIEVVEVKGKWIRLAFQGSKEISIQRTEPVKDLQN